MSKRKKILIALPVVILALMLLTGIAYGEGTQAGFINAASVNMRETPSTTAKILLQLQKDTDIVVEEKQGDWYKITYNDSKGFVFAQYVTLKNVVINTGIVNGTNVNVRSGPDINSEILTRLDKGTKLSIYEYSGSWARILISEDRYGWMCLDFVTIQKTTVSRGGTTEPEKVPEAQTPEAQTPEAQISDGQAPDGQADTGTEKKDIRQELVEYAKKFLGVKYDRGGMSPKAFDCSGFTSYVFKHFNIKLERTSPSQGSNGVKIDRSDLKPGDLVFFDTDGGKNKICHVGIYIGGGKFIHASSGKGKVIISDMTEGFYNKTYMRSRRYIKD